MAKVEKASEAFGSKNTLPIACCCSMDYLVILAMNTSFWRWLENCWILLHNAFVSKPERIFQKHSYILSKSSLQLKRGSILISQKYWQDLCIIKTLARHCQEVGKLLQTFPTPGNFVNISCYSINTSKIVNIEDECQRSNYKKNPCWFELVRNIETKCYLLCI